MQLVINEVSGNSPMALQAVKLLAEFQGHKRSTVSPSLATLHQAMNFWQADT